LMFWNVTFIYNAFIRTKEGANRLCKFVLYFY